MNSKAKAVTEGLQKLTESELMINALLTKKKILRADIKEFTPEQRGELGKVLTQKLSLLKGVEHDQLIDKVKDLLGQDMRNQFWEKNHGIISYTISKLLSEKGRMPNKNDIAVESGLSRQTIHKHLKGYAVHPVYAEQLQQFKFMADKVLATVFLSAKAGDMKAARLYFDMIGQFEKPSPPATQIKNQNNYIQINGTVLSQDTIKQLSPEQLNQIEGIINL